MSELRVIIAGGGPGGPLFPALAIGDEIKSRGMNVMYMGSTYGIEAKQLKDRNENYRLLDIRGIQRTFSLASFSQNLLFPFKFILGYMKSVFTILEFKPQVVVGTGGYASGLENAIDKGATPLGTSIVPVYRFGDAQGHVVFDHRAYSLTRTDQNDWSAGSKSDYRTVMAQNFMSQIYSKGVDAMTGKITIVGDPDWITQDEGFGLSVNNSLYVNGSVNTHRDPTIQINFKTPPDIDTETGLMATHSGDTEYGNSISLFSGYYKITLIKTTIENNTFKQELEIIRVTNQEIEKEPEGESTIHADIQPGTTGYEAWKTNVPDGDVTVAMDIDWNNVG